MSAQAWLRAEGGAAVTTIRGDERREAARSPKPESCVGMPSGVPLVRVMERERNLAGSRFLRFIGASGSSGGAGALVNGAAGRLLHQSP